MQHTTVIVGSKRLVALLYKPYEYPCVCNRLMVLQYLMCRSRIYNSMCIMVCLHTDQKLSSVKDLPNYTMAMHWLMFLCLVGSTRTRLLEIDGDGDRNVGVVDLSEVQGDVGIIIGLQSLVKARIENMVKDMEDRASLQTDRLSCLS